jgi:hypothetical protein
MVGLACLLAAAMVQFSATTARLGGSVAFALESTPTNSLVLIGALLAGEIFLVSVLSGAHRRVEAMVVVAFAALSGTLALALGRDLFLALFPDAFGGLSAILAIGVFGGMFVMFLILIGECSERAKNTVMLVFAAMGGAVIGASFPTATLLLVVTILVAADTILTQARRATAGLEARTLPMTAFTTAAWTVGLGDLLAYAVLMAHVFTRGGVFLLLPSLALLLLGTLATMRWAGRSPFPVVPGLLAPMALAVIPLGITLLSG